MNKIDVIVPLYKGKNTIRKLLDSIASQTIAEEVNTIIVQDADGEDYEEILWNYNCNLMQLEENGGPGVARRVGMQHSDAEYIVFADADDQFVDIFALENLYEAIKKGDYDALNSTFLEEIEDGSLVTRKNDWIWVFGKIYKRSFLEENSIYFNDTRANEDMGFNSVVITVGKIGNYDGVTYLWKFNPNSITRRDDGIYSFTCVEGWLENIKWGIFECKRLGIDEEILKQKAIRAMLICYGWLCEFTECKDERYDMKKFWKWVSGFYHSTYTLFDISEEDIQFVYGKIGSTLKSSMYLPKMPFVEMLKLLKLLI